METFLYGLCGSALAGVTFLAYRHPAAYRRLYLWLCAGNALAWVGASTYNLGLSKALVAASPFLVSEKFSDAQKAVEGVGLPNMVVLFAPMAIVAYLLFLLFLPEMLEDAPPTKSQT